MEILLPGVGDDKYCTALDLSRGKDDTASSWLFVDDLSTSACWRVEEEEGSQGEMKMSTLDRDWALSLRPPTSSVETKSLVTAANQKENHSLFGVHLIQLIYIYYNDLHLVFSQNLKRQTAAGHNQKTN